jgi:ribosomal protein S5
MRSTNPHNVVRATMVALDSMESLEQYAARLGRDVEEIAPNYNVRYATES